MIPTTQELIDLHAKNPTPQSARTVYELLRQLRREVMA